MNNIYNNIDVVIMEKEKSPSCGFGQIYDGTFSGRCKKGNRVTANLLYQNGIKIVGESKINNFLNQ